MKSTKQEMHHLAISALTRVYMDIPAETHHAAKIAALTANTTLKAWMEGLMLAALTKSKK